MCTPSDGKAGRTAGENRLTVREMALFAMLAALMFGSKKLMEALPNIHLVGMLTMLYTVVFRKKALIPLYLYVLLDGVFLGFSPGWVPYLYIWTVLWGVTMLLPRRMKKGVAYAVYAVVCCLHGLLFGVLYAPAQALMFGFDLRQTLAWIAAGFPFDVIHGIGNFCFGLLIVPLAELMRKLLKTSSL